MYFGVLAVGMAGALIARLRPRGMARALFATALAQALVAAIALIARLGLPYSPPQGALAHGTAEPNLRVNSGEGGLLLYSSIRRPPSTTRAGTAASIHFPARASTRAVGRSTCAALTASISQPFHSGTSMAQTGKRRRRLSIRSASSGTH